MRSCIVTERWAQQDSNLRPSGYEPPALPLSYWPRHVQNCTRAVAGATSRWALLLTQLCCSFKCRLACRPPDR
jgi:hypothetical protein